MLRPREYSLQIRAHDGTLKTLIPALKAKGSRMKLYRALEVKRTSAGLGARVYLAPVAEACEIR